MKILFIYCDLFPSFLDWKGSFYIGIGSLSSVLKVEGHEVSLIHVTREFADKKDLLENVKTFNPQLIAFSSTTLTFVYVRKMAEWLYEADLGIPVISGGIHSTLFPLETIETTGIDMACAGEGEISLKNLVEAMDKGEDFRKIEGIWVNDKGSIYKNGVSPIIKNLDSIPFPDRSVFDYPNLELERNGKAVFMASRGCPYHCTYCSNRLLKQTLCENNPGEYVRFKSVDNVIAEIKQVLEEYPFIKYLHFDDDLFFLRKKWAIEFTEKYSSEVGLPFTCNMRPNHLSAEIAGLLKRAGCKEVKIGLESGNDWIRNKILKRNLTDKQMFEAFKFCHDLGIITHSFNMVGLPYESSATILDTIKMNAQMKSDKMQVSVFYPMPKTELYDLCKEKGFYVEKSGYDFFMPMLEIGTISKKRIYYFLKNFKIFVAIYSKAYSLAHPVSKLAVSAIDKLFQSCFLDMIGYVLSILRKVKSFFPFRPQRIKTNGVFSR